MELSRNSNLNQNKSNNNQRRRGGITIQQQEIQFAKIRNYFIYFRKHL